MNSFKSGSGDLDFGGNNKDDDEPEDNGTEAEPTNPVSEGTASTSDEAQTDESNVQSTDDSSGAAEDETAAQNSATEYPYFVRRSKVTDERNVRLEAHVREVVAGQESSFRNDLAEALDTDDISKTDAREFALLYAFENPEGVAELMREEGFGIV